MSSIGKSIRVHNIPRPIKKPASKPIHVPNWPVKKPVKVPTGK